MSDLIMRFGVTNNLRLYSLPGEQTMSSIVTDNIYDRPEVLRLSDPAFRMHVRALSWAAHHGTAPNLPDYALPVVSPLADGPAIISELVGSGLWQPNEIDGLGYILVTADEAPRPADVMVPLAEPEHPGWWKVDGSGDRAIGYFPDIAIQSGEHAAKGAPFSQHVLQQIPRATAIVAVAESILRAHGRAGNHELALEVNLSTHPYIRALGERAPEWLEVALTAGQLTADVPNWRGSRYRDLTAFTDGERYPGQGADQ